MNVYGCTSVSEFLGDNIVYRNLEPVNRALPGLGQLAPRLGLPANRVPRKTSRAYAQVIVEILQQAQQQQHPDIPIKTLVYIGDTRMNDGGAFLNIAQAAGWSGAAFIAADKSEPAAIKLEVHPQAHLYQANRWALLEEFAEEILSTHFPVNEHTAVVFDLDKTILGARGRNDAVIDRARVAAAAQTVQDVMGEQFDREVFQAVYQHYNQTEFHPFTTDNQDYLVYLCLILSAGLFDRQGVDAQIQSGELPAFMDFVAQVDAQCAKLPSALQQVHREVVAQMQAGQPTAFVRFRRKEYETTTALLGHLPDETPAETLLAEEIVLTEEVRRAALAWKQAGALLFGLSDKPDEASLPTPEQAAQGRLPLHQTITHTLGA